MGFLKNMFGKKEPKIVEIFSPIDGTILDLSEVPDEAFASGAIGDGIAIRPEGEAIYAPCDAGEINIFTTNHAVSFETEGGLELIVHFGVDTVTLNGEGFERIGTDGGSVQKGDRLVNYDLAYLKKNAKSIITPIVISNMEEVESIEKSTGRVNVGDSILKITLK